MMTSIRDLLDRGCVQAAVDLALDEGLERVRNEVMEYAWDTGSVAAYAFCSALIGRREDADTHFFASEMMSTALCHLPGGYATALFHTRRAVAINPDDVSLWEYLLLFFQIPETLVSREEAKEVIRRILQMSPDSAVAKSVLEHPKMK